MAAIGNLIDTAAVHVRGAGASRPVELRERARWTKDRAWAWHEATGWLHGCNFTPSTASNQLELWQRATFDPDAIDRELGWAADLGMNAIRLFLHDLVWEADGEAFLGRVDQVLAIAQAHGIRAMPVLFDGIWDPEPRLGVQREPTPGVHNSTWVQGPGAAVVADRRRWPALKPYVDAVLGRFGTDDRVVAWDLFNEPDSPNPAYLRRDPAHKRRLVGDLVELVFDWAVAADPAQPLTIGVYEQPNRHPERASRVGRTALERSDIISFHSYAGADGLGQAIDAMVARGRPVVCTEWMGRPTSPVSLIEQLRDRDVGAFCWGLVDGRTQTRFPWTSWWRRTPPERGWFHELLHPDGTPYDQAEADLLRRVSGR